MASGAVIDFNAGNVTLAHTAGILTCNAAMKATTFTSTSDAVFKKNIETIKNPIDKIMAMRGVEWDWKDTMGDAAGEHSSGVVAQELKKIMPHAVKGKEGGMSVNYNSMMGVLIEAIKEQQTQITELKKMTPRKRILKTGTL